MIDSYRHKGLRRKLVEEVCSKGIKDARVLAALEDIPRHIFMDSSFVEFAYMDKPFPIGSGQTISQPYTVAFQTELLDLKRSHKVLEIGTGSGYQACVLAHLGARVYSVERHHALFVKARDVIDQLGYHARLFHGDGYKGLSAHAPFDRILVTAAAPAIPAPLKMQLKVGGKLVVPVGAGSTQTMVRLTKIGDDQFLEEEFGSFRFVPLLHNKE